MKNSKKIIATSLAAVMALSLAACGNKKPETTEPPVTQDVVTEAPETTEITEAPTEPAPTEPAPVETEPEELTETQSLLKSLSEKCPTEFLTGVISVDHTDANQLSAFTGLTDNTGIVEVAALEPMISSQAYSVVLIKTDGTVDVDAMSIDVLENINPAKWVCTEADTVSCTTAQDYILLVMLNSELASSTVNDITEAFTTLLYDAMNGTSIAEETEHNHEAETGTDAYVETESEVITEVVTPDYVISATETEG